MEKTKGVAIILYTSDGKILLQHRTPDAPRLPNKWGCFGGRIEAAELPIDAVKRECLEELEYELVNPLHFLTKEVLSEGTVDYFAEKYDISKTLVLREGRALGWFTVEAALELDSTESVQLLLESLKEQNPLF